MKYPTHIILDLQRSYLQNSHIKVVIPTKCYPINNSITSKTTSSFIAFFKLVKLTQASTNKPLQTTLFNSYSVWDINFLRKEKIYTKLKYSRCPQYDIISGGFAAIFAGFIGFLISEKFGIELVDSGDFYTALMYGIFSVFAIRPLLRIYSITHTPYTPWSLKYGAIFWQDLLTLLVRFLQKCYNNLRV